MRICSGIPFLLPLLVAGGVARAEELPAQPQFNYLAPAHVPVLSPPPRHYRAPIGFDGHEWGEPRSSFSGLPSEPAVVLGAWTHGKESSQNLICTGRGMQQCTVDDYVRAARNPQLEGDGFHVLSEYLVEGRGFKLPRTGVTFYPVVYQFCANWHGMRRKVPKDFDDMNVFCGMRMLFDTESSAQLRELPPDHVTQYDLVLAELIARFGKPANFMWHGKVTVEPVDGPPIWAWSRDKAHDDRKFDVWRWCPAPTGGLMTRCKASIVLSIDPDRGRGIVLFSTPEVWEYAYARESGDARPDPLYTLLHALPLRTRTAFAVHMEERRKTDAAKKMATQKAGEPAIAAPGNTLNVEQAAPIEGTNPAR